MQAVRAVVHTWAFVYAIPQRFMAIQRPGMKILLRNSPKTQVKFFLIKICQMLANMRSEHYFVQSTDNA